MQQTSSSPAPEAPPAPPAPSAIQAPAGAPAAASTQGQASAATLADGAIALEGLPRTAEEVQGLRERREILRDQLQRATNRRAELVGQLDGREGQTLSPAARAGLEQRLSVLDERIIQIERDQAATERLLSNAPPSVLALTATETRVPAHMVDEDEAVLAAFGAFGFGVVLTMILGRLRRRFGRRRAHAATAAAALPDDPRIERLTLAVDAIAEEVERIGEGQRFVTQLLAGRRETASVLSEAERR